MIPHLTSKKLHSPHSPKLDPPQPLSEDEPFDHAPPLLVSFPFRSISYDGYIDDIIAVALDKANNVRKIQEAVPLAVHTIYRPVDVMEHTARDDALSLRKIAGNGTPSEQKVVLGWLICTRLFRVFLPQEKAIFWSSEIQNLLDCNKRIQAKTIERIIGKLNHLGFIIPHSRYFLNRIRYFFYKCKSYGPQYLNPRVRDDLALLQHLLKHSS